MIRAFHRWPGLLALVLAEGREKAGQPHDLSPRPMKAQEQIPVEAVLVAGVDAARPLPQLTPPEDSLLRDEVEPLQ